VFPLAPAVSAREATPAAASVASVAAPSAMGPVEVRSSKGPTAPWVVDIVEQRKGKPGGSE
jgi:hypothetical protein